MHRSWAVGQPWQPKIPHEFTITAWLPQPGSHSLAPNDKATVRLWGTCSSLKVGRSVPLWDSLDIFREGCFICNITFYWRLLHVTHWQPRLHFQMEGCFNNLTQTHILLLLSLIDDRVEPIPYDTPKPSSHTRFVCVSDTHSRTDGIQMPYGDVLLHTGDFTELGLPSEVKKFNDWLGKESHTHCCFFALNPQHQGRSLLFCRPRLDQKWCWKDV